MPSVIPGEVATLGSQAKAFLERREQEPLVEIVRSSAVLHHEITRIHPFDDGNGRVARLYMNYVWRSCGLPYVLLPKAGGEEEMSRVLKEADGGDMEPAVEFYSSLLEDSLDRVLVHYGMS
jgi:fido (protein-threonine AMPylation protein)